MLRLLLDYTTRLQVLAFAGELLSNAESLLRDGLHTSEVADGYSKAAAKAGPPDYTLWAGCSYLSTKFHV